MERGDRIQDFQRRLDELPPDLEELYDKIMHSLDPFYLEHAAQYFTLVESAPRPITLLEFSFADEEIPASALKMALGQMTRNKIQNRVEAVARRLNNRCKGLLEIDRAVDGDSIGKENLTVQYLHRTVKDFVKSPKAQDFLQASLQTEFDPATQLCVAYLMDAKTALGFEHQAHLDRDSPEVTIMVNILVDKILYFMYAAASAYRKNAGAIIALLDDLKNVVGLSDHLGLVIYALSKIRTSQTYLKARHLAEIGSSVLSPRMLDDVFLYRAVQNNITTYVRAKAEWGALIVPSASAHPEERWPLLMDALSLDVPDPEMVLCLLEMGADPNFKISGVESQTPWIVALTNASFLYTFQNDLGSSELYLQVEQHWKETLKLLYSWGGYRATVPDSRLTPISRQMLRDIRSETPVKKSPDSSRSWLGLSIWGSSSKG